MGIYSLGLVSSSAAAGTAKIEIIAGDNAFRLLDIFYQVDVNGGGNAIGFGRPRVKAAQPNLVRFLADDPADPISTTNAAVSWSSSPQEPAAFLRRFSIQLGGAQNLPFTLAFPRGILVKPGESLVLWNITTGSGGPVNMVIEE